MGVLDGLIVLLASDDENTLLQAWIDVRHLFVSPKSRGHFVHLKEIDLILDIKLIG